MPKEDPLTYSDEPQWGTDRAASKLLIAVLWDIFDQQQRTRIANVLYTRSITTVKELLNALNHTILGIGPGSRRMLIDALTRHGFLETLAINGQDPVRTIALDYFSDDELQRLFEKCERELMVRAGKPQRPPRKESL